MSNLALSISFHAVLEFQLKEKYTRGERERDKGCNASMKEYAHRYTNFLSIHKIDSFLKLYKILSLTLQKLEFHKK